MFIGAHPTLVRSFGGGLKPQDVFATSLYTGNQTNIIVPFDPDFVWEKERNASGSHVLFDRSRGAGKVLFSNSTNAEADIGSSFAKCNSGGYTSYGFATTSNVVGWPFKKAPKFFDIVTYTGDGTSGRQIPHGLGVAPGMVIVKDRSIARSWCVWQRTLPNNFNLYLERTDAQTPNSEFGVNVSNTASTFQVGGTNTNASGESFVAYLFAHDPDPVNGIIQCGSFATPGSGNATVTLGWQPQFLIVKRSSGAGQWNMIDVTRGWNGTNATLNPNTSDSESIASSAGSPNATGFTITSTQQAVFTNSDHIYLAIRAPI